MDTPSRYRYGTAYWDLLRGIEISGISIRESRYEAGMLVPAHSHRRMGFHLLMRGDYVDVTPRASTPFKPRNVAYLPIEHEHAVQIGNGGAHCFGIELDQRWRADMEAKTEVPNHSIGLADGPIPSLMLRIYKEFELMDPFSPLAIEALTMEVVIGFVRACRTWLDRKPPVWLSRARDLLGDPTVEPLSPSAIALQVGVHPGHLSRAFRAHFGCTVGEYARRVRIEHACRRLVHSEDTIAEIALEAGFADQSHFSRTFKHLTGTSPARFRQETRSR